MIAVRRWREGWSDRRGAVLVEFALALPLLLSLLMGMLCYGQYIWLAHSTQAMANDAARATMAGLTATERLSIAKAVVANALPSVPELRADMVRVAIDEANGQATTRLRVDARSLSLLRLGFVPLPSPIIERRASAPLNAG